MYTTIVGILLSLSLLTDLAFAVLILRAGESGFRELALCWILSMTATVIALAAFAWMAYWKIRFLKLKAR